MEKKFLKLLDYEKIILKQFKYLIFKTKSYEIVELRVRRLNKDPSSGEFSCQLQNAHYTWR